MNTNMLPIPKEITLGTGSCPAEAELRDSIDTDIMPFSEGYLLRIDRDQVTITGADAAGLQYGRQTLAQLRDQNADGLPCLTVRDWPSKPYRGFMLDVARHFFSVTQVKKMIHLCAMHKLNVFHFHLTEDQGWRLAVEGLPLLTEVGSIRKETMIRGRGDGQPHGGFYTRDELLEISSFAREHHVEIIPEIDLPGHAGAALAAYPHLACSPGDFEVKTRFGIFEDVLCAGKDSTYSFLEMVLDEAIEIFRPKRIHLGGDEAPKFRWEACPHCRKRMQEEGLQDTEALQGYMTNRIQAYLRTKGVATIVWNESLTSGILDRSVTVQHWMDGKDQKHTREAIKSGRKVILSDFFYTYLDYPHFMTPLRKMYNCHKAMEGVNPWHVDNIIGYEAPLWTEYVTDREKLETMVFPRLTAIAEVAWAGEDQLDYDDFILRLKTFIPMLKKEGASVTALQASDPKGWLNRIRTFLYMAGLMDMEMVQRMRRMKRYSRKLEKARETLIQSN